MGLSKFYKDIPWFDQIPADETVFPPQPESPTLVPEQPVVAPAPAPAPVTPDLPTQEDSDKALLRAYMAKWQAAQAAKAPDTSGYEQRSSDRDMLSGITKGANLIANIKGTPNPYDLSDQLKGLQARDDASLKAGTDAYNKTKSDGLEAMKAMPGITKSIADLPSEDAKRQEVVDKNDKNSDLAVAMTDALNRYGKFGKIPAGRYSPAQLDKLLPEAKVLFENDEKVKAAALAKKNAGTWTKKYDIRVPNEQGVIENRSFIKNLSTGEVVDLGMASAVTPEQKGNIGVSIKESNETQDMAAKAKNWDRIEGKIQALRGKGKFEGMAAGLLTKGLLKKGGSTDAESTQEANVLGQALIQYIFEMSGKATSDKERAELTALMPQVNDSDATLDNKFKAIRYMTRNKINEARNRQGLPAVNFEAGEAFPEFASMETTSSTSNSGARKSLSDFKKENNIK